jgi:hypothetical protein
VLPPPARVVDRPTKGNPPAIRIGLTIVRRLDAKINMADERADRIKDLAAATTVQTEVANRAWTTLMTVAVLAVLPRPQVAEIALPLGLGTVPPVSFHLAMFSMLAVLIIAFSAAHAQQVRAQRLAMNALAALGNESISESKIHPRDYFDMLRSPSLTRVAPLAQLFQGVDAFYGSSRRPPSWRRRISVPYYVALKIVSWVVYFGFPTAALWLSFVRMQPAAPWWWPLCIVGVVSTMPLVHVLLVDVSYVSEVAGVIASNDPGKPPNQRLQPTAPRDSPRRRG